MALLTCEQFMVKRIQRRMDETIRKELEIVQRAQANIDRLVKGGGRLPPVAPKETSKL